MNYRHFGVTPSWRDSHLCIALPAEGAGSNLQVISDRLTILKKRFGLSIVLVASSPGDIGMETMRSLLLKGAVNQIVCSGSGRYVFQDLFAAAKRTTGKGVVFANAMDLVTAFPRILKFLVEWADTDIPLRASSCGRLLYSSIEGLKGIGAHYDVSDWDVLIETASLDIHALLSGSEDAEDDELDSVAGPIGNVINKMLHGGGGRSGNAVPVGPNAKTTPAGLATQEDHLFVSQQGLERLGGYRKLASLPLVVGGRAIDAFGSCWVIDNDGRDAVAEVAGNRNRNVTLHIIKGVERIGQSDRYLIFDINPAPVAEDTAKPASAGKTAVSLPRQVLYARIVENMTLATPSASEAVFVMSNYNKAQYIQSSLYSLLSQTWPKIRVELVDDVSTDDSVALARDFQQALQIPDDILSIRVNVTNRGTYWIRNSVIARHRETERVYLVNDSDDYSAAQRAFLQLSTIAATPALRGCFGDIVRVDQTYSVLPLNNQVERYGTASLGCRARLHSEVGYFQNIRKNADTEFIERVKGFVGKAAIQWFRYPVLFQPFDGGNLTADIYAIGKTKRALVQSLGNRSAHHEAFKKHHARLDKAGLPSHFNFPLASMPKEYAHIGSDYLIRGYRGFDGCLLMVPRATDKKMIESLVKKGFHVMTQTASRSWRITSTGSGEYLSDLEFADTLHLYSQRKGFYGYIVSLTLLNVSPEYLKSPNDLLIAVIGNHVNRSKAESDRYVYMARNGEDSSIRALAAAEIRKSFELLEKGKDVGLLFHSETLAEILRNVPISL